MRSAVAFASAAVLMLTSCGESPDGGGQSVRPLDPSPEVIPVEHGFYFQISWLAPDTIALGRIRSPEDPPSRSEIWTLKPSGRDFESLDLPESPDCRITEYVAPVSLGSTQMAVIRRCVVVKIDPRKDLYDLIRLDESMQALEVPIAGVTHRPTQLSWNASEGRGIASTGSDTCSTLIWVQPGNGGFFSVQVDDGPESFNIGPELLNPGPGGCAAHARVSWPAWSPDGGTIAFAASPQSTGVNGQARLAIPWNLYVMDVRSHEVDRVIDDINEPRALTWSDDGDYLAFSGGLKGQDGTWIFSPSTNRLLLASHEYMDWLDWAPDGDQLVGIFDSEPSAWPPKDEVRIIDLNELP